MSVIERYLKETVSLMIEAAHLSEILVHPTTTHCRNTNQEHLLIKSRCGKPNTYELIIVSFHVPLPFDPLNTNRGFVP